MYILYVCILFTASLSIFLIIGDRITGCIRAKRIHNQILKNTDSSS